MARAPFLSLLAGNSVVKRQAVVRSRNPFEGVLRAHKRKGGKLITDASGFSFFNSPRTEHTTSLARKQGFSVTQSTTANGTKFASAIKGPSGRSTRINPSTFLRTKAELRQVKNTPTPFTGDTGSREGVFVLDREITPDKFRTNTNRSSDPFGGSTSEKFDSSAFIIKHNAGVDAENAQFQPFVEDFNNERLRFAKQKNRALNNFGSKDPAKLNANARSEQNNVSGISRKKINSKARLGTKGNSKGVGLGRGGAGLGI